MAANTSTDVVVTKFFRSSSQQSQPTSNRQNKNETNIEKQKEAFTKYRDKSSKEKNRLFSLLAVQMPAVSSFRDGEKHKRKKKKCDILAEVAQAKAEKVFMIHSDSDDDAIMIPKKLPEIVWKKIEVKNHTNAHVVEEITISSDEDDCVIMNSAVDVERSSIDPATRFILNAAKKKKEREKTQQKPSTSQAGSPLSPVIPTTSSRKNMPHASHNIISKNKLLREMQAETSNLQSEPIHHIKVHTTSKPNSTPMKPLTNLTQEISNLEIHSQHKNSPSPPTLKTTGVSKPIPTIINGKCIPPTEPKEQSIQAWVSNRNVIKSKDKPNLNRSPNFSQPSITKFFSPGSNKQKFANENKKSPTISSQNSIRKSDKKIHAPINSQKTIRKNQKNPSSPSSSFYKNRSGNAKSLVEKSPKAAKKNIEKLAPPITITGGNTPEKNNIENHRPVVSKKSQSGLVKRFSSIRSNPMITNLSPLHHSKKVLNKKPAINRSKSSPSVRGKLLSSTKKTLDKNKNIVCQQPAKDRGLTAKEKLSIMPNLAVPVKKSHVSERNLKTKSLSGLRKENRSASPVNIANEVEAPMEEAAEQLDIPTSSSSSVNHIDHQLMTSHPSTIEVNKYAVCQNQSISPLLDIEEDFPSKETLKSISPKLKKTPKKPPQIKKNLQKSKSLKTNSSMNSLKGTTSFRSLSKESKSADNLINHAKKEQKTTLSQQNSKAKSLVDDISAIPKKVSPFSLKNLNIVPQISTGVHDKGNPKQPERRRTLDFSEPSMNMDTASPYESTPFPASPTVNESSMGLSDNSASESQERTSLFELADLFDFNDSSDNESLPEFNQSQSSLCFEDSLPPTPINMTTPQKLDSICQDEDSRSTFTSLLNESRKDFDEVNDFETSPKKSQSQKSPVLSKSVIEKMMCEPIQIDAEQLSQHSVCSTDSTDLTIKKLQDIHKKSSNIPMTPRKFKALHMKPEPLFTPSKDTPLSSASYEKVTAASVKRINGMYRKHKKEGELNQVEIDLIKYIKDGGYARYCDSDNEDGLSDCSEFGEEFSAVSRIRTIMETNEIKKKSKEAHLGILIKNNDVSCRIMSLQEFVGSNMSCLSRFEKGFIHKFDKLRDITVLQTKTLERCLEKVHMYKPVYKWLLQVLPFQKESKVLSKKIMLHLLRNTPTCSPYDYKDFRKALLLCGVEPKLLPESKKVTVKMELQEDISGHFQEHEERLPVVCQNKFVHIFNVIAVTLSIFCTSFSMTEISYIVTVLLISFADSSFISLRSECAACIQKIISAIPDWDNMKWALTSKILQYVPSIVNILDVCECLSMNDKCKSLSRCIALSSIRAMVDESNINLDENIMLENLVKLSCKITPKKIRDTLANNDFYKDLNINELAYKYFDILMNMLRICLSGSCEKKREVCLQKIHDNLQTTCRRIRVVDVVQSLSKCKLMSFMNKITHEINKRSKPKHVTTIFKYLRSEPVNENVVSSQSTNYDESETEDEDAVSKKKMKFDDSCIVMDNEEEEKLKNNAEKRRLSSSDDDPANKIMKMDASDVEPVLLGATE